MTAKFGWRRLALVVFLGVFGAAAWADVGAPLEPLPIQDNGRIKPFDTFARESLQLIYGKTTYKGKSAAEVVFTWLLVPQHWLKAPIVEVRHSGLRDALKITGTQMYFSPEALLTNPRVPLLFQELQTRLSRKEKLNPYYTAVERLENQLSLFQAIRSGQALAFVPDPNSDKWKSVAELDGDMQAAFMRVSKGFVDSISANQKNPQPTPEFTAAVHDFMAKAQAQAPSKYANMNKIHWEERLNHWQPFMWAWIAYLIGLSLLALAQVGVPGAAELSWVGLIAGFVLHGLGMGIRIYLAGRPPVSNMYETVVWVPWAVVLFGFILERIQKNKMLLICASGVAIFCLILTNIAPNVLDSSIEPLQPVLRSTFWLSTHVLIITLSYAAFFLAFALGDVMLFFYLRGEDRHTKRLKEGAQSIYRAIQVGVVLLALGIILGGVWADYSWGRFWGWDPKETWALIALLGYVAVLHGRLVGWVRNFGLAASAVVTFSLVIMSWYGVNFVLGAGLHSYGFGAGGVQYVTAFVIIHLLYVAYVSTVRYQRGKN